jgi:hypothetical protein
MTIRPRRGGYQVIVYAGIDPVTGRQRQIARQVKGKREADRTRALRQLSTGELRHLARSLAESTNLCQVAQAIVADLQHHLPSPQAERFCESSGAVLGSRQASTSGTTVGLPRFDGQGWWLGQATCVRASLRVAVSNSSGVR